MIFHKKVVKSIILSIAVFLGLTPILSAGISVHASELETVNYSSSEYQKYEEQLTEAIEYILDEATIYNDNGVLKNLDFTKIYDKYGYSSDLQRVQKFVFYERTMKSDMKQCAIIAIQDTLGVTAVQALIQGGIVGLLQKKAAKEIAKLVAKYAFKIASPAGAAASLIGSFSRCMWF